MEVLLSEGGFKGPGVAGLESELVESGEGWWGVGVGGGGLG